MKHFVLHRTIFANGERFPVLLDRSTAQPLVIPTRYAVTELRQRVGEGSMRQSLQVIGWFHEWADTQLGENLEARLRNGPFISQAELQRFARYLRSGRNEKVIAVLGRTERPMNANTFNTHWDALKPYLLWAMWVFHRAGRGSPLQQTYDSACRELKFAFESLGQRSVEPKERLAYQAKEVTELLALVHPESPSNPFRRDLRLRNYVMLKLMFETGFRRGEVGALYIEDIKWRGAEPTAQVIRRQDNQLDPRLEEPKAKTLERVVPISRSLAAEVRKYVDERSGFARHPFLFTSVPKCSPLGVRQIDRLFEVLGRHFQQFAGIEAHDTRRSFNNIFDSEARRDGVKEDDARALQTYINGWVPGSQQPEIYSRRSIQEKAIELARIVQNRLYRD